LPPADGSESIVNPTWSPTGETVAYVAIGEEDNDRSLRLLDVRSGETRDVVAPPAGRFVVDYAWMPDGVSLLFTEGGELGGAVTGIDLWRVDATGENRELVVSAGTVAPVARITNIQPSPDGRAVAYSVLVPGESDPRVDSVWVRDLSSRLGFRIHVPSVVAVDKITWTDRGLAMDVVTADGSRRSATLAVLQVSRDGAVSALWAAPVIAGTPVAGTPIASPERS
jgi:Tol biopolymer transport system component